MAEYQTAQTQGVGTQTSAAIDEGLRTHMTKVYSTMSMGMVITALAAWAFAGLATTTEPTAMQIGADQYLTSFGQAIYASPLRWVILLAPLAMVFGFGAVMNRASAAAM